MVGSNFYHMEKLKNHSNLLLKLMIDDLSGGFPIMAGEHGKSQTENFEQELLVT